MGERVQSALLIAAVLIVFCGGGVCYAWAHDYWDIERDYYRGPE